MVSTGEDTSRGRGTKLSPLTAWAEFVMGPLQVTDPRPLMISHLLVLGIFTIDLITPRGIADGVLYIAPVLLSLWSPYNRHTISVLVSSTFLGIVGLLLSQETVLPMEIAALNRCLALSVVWTAAVLGLRLNRMRQALHNRNTILGTILDNAAEGFVTSDYNGNVVMFNRSAERVFKRSAEETIGHPVWQLVAPPHNAEYQACIISTHERGTTPAMCRGREVLGQRGDGSTFPMHMAVSYMPSIKLFTAVVRDMTPERELERRVLEAVAGEQQRIAQDLHDGVGQDLTALSTWASVIQNRMDAGEALTPDDLGRMSEMASRCNAHARQLIRGVHPAALDEGNFGAALASMTEAGCELHDIECELDIDRSVQLPDRYTATQFYYIAREAIHNAFRHARAEHLRVRLTRWDGTITLSISDDGVGMSPDKNSGHGMHTMAYRARAIGAHLAIESESGQGTTVTCTYNIPTQS